MAHLSAGAGYHQLIRRLNRAPQGAPPSRSLLGILRILVDEQDAERLSKLPLRPFGARKAAQAWGIDAGAAGDILERLAERALLLDIVDAEGGRTYFFPPPMAGFLEFSMMRVRADIDQPLLGKLLYQYINVEEDFIKALFPAGQACFGRVFVHEPALDSRQAVQILDYEKASEVIRTSHFIGTSICYCRHKMEHVGYDCEAPKDICLTFGFVAESLIRHEFARRIDRPEALDLLQRAYGLNLVQCGENVRRNVNFICSCCRCCCEGMIAARKLGHLHAIWSTNYIPECAPSACVGCSRCASICPIDAVSVLPLQAEAGALPRYRPTVDEDLCLGCGICVRVCPTRALRLVERRERVITPADSVHRAVVMAIEQGLLQNLIFDNLALMSHRTLASILGVVLRLPPMKQILASRQLQSRWLETILSRGLDRAGWMKSMLRLATAAARKGNLSTSNG